MEWSVECPLGRNPVKAPLCTATIYGQGLSGSDGSDFAGGMGNAIAAASVQADVAAGRGDIRLVR